MSRNREEQPGFDNELPGFDDELPGFDDELPGFDDELPGFDDEEEIKHIFTLIYEDFHAHTNNNEHHNAIKTVLGGLQATSSATISDDKVNNIITVVTKHDGIDFNLVTDDHKSQIHELQQDHFRNFETRHPVSGVVSFKSNFLI